MTSGRTPLVKICGLTRNIDALFAQRVGADYVGMVLTQGFGRSVPAGAGPGVVSGVTVPRVAVTVDESPGANVALARSIDASIIQLHGDESPSTAGLLKSEGGWAVWKGIRARSVEDVQRAIDAFAETIDGIVVEGWRPGQVGGAGMTLQLAADEFRALLPPSLTFVLAGGLRPDSVARAVARFQPDVVDVSSGVELAQGSKDPGLVEAFTHNARTATVGERADPLG